MKFEKYYILETNILLEDATNIFKLSKESKNLIILTETVLDEIDSKKSGFDEINFQAREFARILENSKIIESIKYQDKKIVRLKIKNRYETIIDIVSKDEYIVSSKNVSSNILNDRKILELAVEIKDYYNNLEVKSTIL